VGALSWNGQWQNNLPIRDLNQVLGCTNLTLVPIGYHINNHVVDCTVNGILVLCGVICISFTAHEQAQSNRASNMLIFVLGGIF
jgi:hypothetical protein